MTPINPWIWMALGAGLMLVWLVVREGVMHRLQA